MVQKHNLNMSRKMDANTLGNYYGQDYFMLDPPFIGYYGKRPEDNTFFISY